MLLVKALATCFCCVSVQALVSSSKPTDFPGSEVPYQVTPTDGDVTAVNKLGTYLYAFEKCSENFGPGAKGKIEGAYYDAWVMSK